MALVYCLAATMKGLRPLIVGGSGKWWPRPGRFGAPRRSGRAQSSASGSGGSYLERVKGLNGPLKAAATSGCLAAAGDLITQTLTSQNTDIKSWDWQRTGRFLGWGAAFYGPFQFYWYNFLDWIMPSVSTANFLTKVAANQLVLAPLVLLTVFSWNLALTGGADQIENKIKTDLVPTMLNGWKFWIPAACVNFFVIPLSQQVLFMSTCGMLWSAYLSYASTNTVRS